MREQFHDYEEKIQEKIDQEAHEMEKAIESDPEIAQAEPGESMDRKVFAAISEYEDSAAEKDDIFEKLSEEDREALRLGRELQKRRKTRCWKRLAAAVAVCVLVCGIGVTSVGGPERAVELVKRTLGGRESTRINVSSEDTKVADDAEEEQAYQDIEDELGVVPVKVIGFTHEMKFEYYEIDSSLRTAILTYKYDDKNLTYWLTDSYTEESLGVDTEDRIIDKYIYTVDKYEIEVLEYKVHNSYDKRYVAKFEYNGIYYQLTGTMKKTIFEKILDGLHFS